MLTYTPLRHRMLREADAGTLMRVWMDFALTRTQWRWVKDRAQLTTGESRTVGLLDRSFLLLLHTRLGTGLSSPLQVGLSKVGRQLLSEWDEQHGDPLTKD